MNQFLYKSFLQKIAALLLGITALGSAPFLTTHNLGVAGNGLISVCEYKDNTTHSSQYYEMSDSQYALMGTKGGETYNPNASSTAKWVRCFQYHVGDSPLASVGFISATSSSKVATPDPTMNFKDDDTISTFQLISRVPLVQHAYAAIAFDAKSASGVVTATSQTWAHTVAGSNTILFLYGKVRSTDPVNLQLATYNGTQMSTTTSVASYNDGQYGWMMHLANPSTGTHNIVTLFNSNLSTTFAAASYTGASQASIPDSSNTNGGDGTSASFSLSTTVVASNSWLVMGSLGLDGACSGVTGQGAIREGGNPILSDSNGTVGTGSQSISLTGCGNRVENKIIVSFAPFVATASGVAQPLILIQDLEN